MIFRRGQAALAVLGLAVMTHCQEPLTTVRILHDSSLTPLVRQAARLFERNNPSIRILSEASGSLDIVRRVSEPGMPADLVAVADDRLIGRFLIPEFTSSGFHFFGNEMVLATGRPNLFTDKALRQEWQRDWHRRLASGKFAFGLSDPDRDSSGYYTHLVWKLAEIHYDETGFYRTMTALIDPALIRPRSWELVELLKTGRIDFALLFRSTAIQSRLEYLRLPREVSLGDHSQSGRYGRVFHLVEGSPGSSFEVTGTAIRYGICRLRNENPQADDFLSFLLGDEVARIARQMGFSQVARAEFNR